MNSTSSLFDRHNTPVDSQAARFFYGTPKDDLLWLIKNEPTEGEKQTKEWIERIAKNIKGWICFRCFLRQNENVPCDFNVVITKKSRTRYNITIMPKGLNVPGRKFVVKKEDIGFFHEPGQANSSKRRRFAADVSRYLTYATTLKPAVVA